MRGYFKITMVKYEITRVVTYSSLGFPKPSMLGDLSFSAAKTSRLKFDPGHQAAPPSKSARAIWMHFWI
jgi:hypothetical protein